MSQRERQPAQQQQRRQPAAEFLGLAGLGLGQAGSAGGGSAASPVRRGALQRARPAGAARAGGGLGEQADGEHQQQPPADVEHLLLAVGVGGQLDQPVAEGAEVGHRLGIGHDIGGEPRQMLGDAAEDLRADAVGGERSGSFGSRRGGVGGGRRGGAAGGGGGRAPRVWRATPPARRCAGVAPPASRLQVGGAAGGRSRAGRGDKLREQGAGGRRHAGRRTAAARCQPGRGVGRRAGRCAGAPPG